MRLISKFVAISCFAFVTMMIPGPSLAWKVDAHVWIAAEVLDDARDGSISISFNGASQKIPLPARHVRALRAHPKIFLLGSLGPDAFPDVYAGQIVIHPSFPGGWGTADWLRHLMQTPEMSDKDLAFILGYLTHAAADTFGHTFVNRYAGDLFDPFEHPSAAIRHINIESLVSNYLPPLTDPQSGTLATVAAMLRTDGRIEFPESLVLNRLLFDKDAVRQFDGGGARHLSLAQQLYEDLGNLLAEDGLIASLEADITDLALEFLAEAPVDDRISGELARLDRELNDRLNDAAEKARDVLLDLNDKLSEIEGLPIDLTESALSEATRLSARASELALQVDKLEGEVFDAGRNLDDIPPNEGWVVKTVGRFVCEELPWCPWDVCCRLAEVPSRVHSAKWEAAKRRLDDKRRARDSARSELSRTEARLQTAIAEGFKVIRQAHELHRASRATVISMALDQPFGNQFRAHFQRWHDGIPVALVEFTRANATAIVNSVDPAHPSITKPLSDWLHCYGPVFVSVPVRIMEGGCYLFDGIAELRGQIDKFEGALAEVVGLGEVVRRKEKVEREIERLKSEVFNEAVVAGLGEFDKLAGTPNTRLFKALTEEVSQDKVNREFSSDPGGQGLPLIPDAGDRVFAEMAVRDGAFDPESFHAIYNSIVLSKLALLDATRLQRLAALAGVHNTIYGPRLYGDGTPESDNILYGFLRSIDGNHQWHELAPPHPRTNAIGYDRDDFEKRYEDPTNFGYGYRDTGCERVRGMRLWVDPGAREALFKKIFRGKIAAGIDTPDELGSGFGAALPSAYPSLFSEGDEWGADGITLVKGPHKILHITGTGPAGRELLVLVRGVEVGRYNYDAAGQIRIAINIPAHLLPAHVEVIEVGGRGALSYAFALGCADGRIEMDTPHVPDILVERGDTLWHISQRIVSNGSRYPELAEMNAGIIDDPDLIYPGQVFRSPWVMPLSIAVSRQVGVVELTSR